MAPSALAEIRAYAAERLSAAVRRQCREGKCSLGLDSVGEFVMLKGELVRPNKAMCDCIVFLVAPPPMVVLAELKAKTVHAREVGRKLRNAARAVADIITGCPSFGVRPRLLPLTLANRWTRSELKVLELESVTFAGKSHPIGHHHCGDRLSDILGKA